MSMQALNRKGDRGADDAVQASADGTRAAMVEGASGYEAQMAALAPSQPVQALGGMASGQVHQAAAHGISGSSGQLPHLDTIQQSFGHHDVSNVQAHTDSAAKQGSAAMGATAFATGNHVAFGGSTDLHTAAHEAAHVVQQRGGVQLKGGVGEEGDFYEQHADAVADRVVQGKSATDLLDAVAPGGGKATGPAVQGMVQRMIGYEFETNVAIREKKSSKRFWSKYSNLPKMHSVTKSSGLDMQVDTNPINGSNIEFVSDPFPVDSGGRASMVTSLDRLTDWTDKLANGDHTAENGQTFGSVGITGVDDKYRFRPLNYLTGNPQVTAGLSLKEVKGVMDLYAAQKAHKGPSAEGPAPQVNVLFGNWTGEVQTKFLTDIIEAVAALKPSELDEEGGRFGDEPLSHEMQALLFMMASYLKNVERHAATMRTRDPGNREGFRNSKELSVMLARTNFARMFKMIPAIEQQIFKSNPNMMVRAVSQAGGGLTMTEKIYPFGFKKGGAGNRRTVEVDLTREDWAMGVTQGHDMLTKEWWDKVGNDMLDPEHSGDELSKSLGSHGDKVDQDRYYEQAILEFRKMKQDMTPAQFKTEMIKNWDFLRGVMQAPWEE